MLNKIWFYFIEKITLLYVILIVSSTPISCTYPTKQNKEETTINKQYADTTEIVSPIVLKSFINCQSIEVNTSVTNNTNFLSFDGLDDNDGQVDPQVAVGANKVVHATNSGISIFDKEGNLVHATSHLCFNDGIDPKLFFDMHNQIFAMDLWCYYDKAKKKPLNLSVSATNDPTKKWYTYPISLTTAVDGGGLGYSKKWLGYTYPKDNEQGGTVIVTTEEVKKEKAATIYHFNKNIGQPAFVQDATDDLYFLDVTDTTFILNKITSDKNNKPYLVTVWKKLHQLKYNDYPLPSAQKGTEKLVASGDRNPKNLVIQGGYLWFCQTVNVDGNAGVQWHQLNLTNGSTIQTGIISKKNSNYIQSTLAVNKNLDVLIGFQETNKNMYISPCFTFRKSTDKLNTMQAVTVVEKGAGNYSTTNTDTQPWGDYSGSMIDGDNLTDLWTVQTIMNKNNKVNTKIIKVKMQ